MATTAPRDVMAGVAARLMGRMPGTQSQSSTSLSAAAATPRTMPSSQVTASVNRSGPAASPKPAPAPAPTPTAKENIRPPPAQSKATAPTPTKPTTPAVKGDVKMTDIDSGPSLIGNAEQLALAREFSQTATPGGRKARPGSRGRLLSTQASFGDSSSRSPVAAAALPIGGGYPPLSATSRLRPAPRPQVGSYPASPSSTTSRPETAKPPPMRTEPISAEPPAFFQPQTPAWNAFATKTEEKNVTKSLEKMEISDNHTPSADSPNKKVVTTAKPVSGWQMKDITNTLKDRAADASSPPHLRVKAADAGTVHNPIIIDDSKKGDGRTTDRINGASTLSKATEDKTSGPAAVKESEKKPALHNGTAALSNNTTISSATPQESTANGDSALTTLEAVKEMLKTVSDRVGALERENFDMQKQLESMLQAEERRKFLGTDSAKEPFGIDVQSPSGIVENVQVNTELTVSDLIRRVRTKANLLAAATLNPRIVVDGVQIGHTTALGEAGISKDGKVEVVLRYDSGVER